MSNRNRNDREWYVPGEDLKVPEGIYYDEYSRHDDAYYMRRGGGTTKKDEAHSWANAVKRIGPYAWKLLVLIVKKHGDNREHGTEVLVQGFTELGSTPQKYRTALKQLKRMGLISFVGVRAGTLARINGPDVFFMVETEENWEGYGRLTVL